MVGASQSNLACRVLSATFLGDGQGHKRSRTVTHLIFEKGLLGPGSRAASHASSDLGYKLSPFSQQLIVVLWPASTLFL